MYTHRMSLTVLRQSVKDTKLISITGESWREPWNNFLEILIRPTRKLWKRPGRAKVNGNPSVSTEWR